MERKCVFTLRNPPPFLANSCLYMASYLLLPRIPQSVLQAFGNHFTLRFRGIINVEIIAINDNEHLTLLPSPGIIIFIIQKKYDKFIEDAEWLMKEQITTPVRATRPWQYKRQIQKPIFFLLHVTQELTLFLSTSPVSSINFRNNGVVNLKRSYYTQKMIVLVNLLVYLERND